MCNSKQPLISIIVCVYNTEKYIAKCLKSICAQTYANIEIILLNDGSTDKTAMIINEWQEKDERIVLVQQENKGLAVARNVGLDISRGEYIGFVDADDYIEKKTCFRYCMMQFYKVIACYPCVRTGLWMRMENFSLKI